MSRRRMSSASGQSYGVSSASSARQPLLSGADDWSDDTELEEMSSMGVGTSARNGNNNNNSVNKNDEMMSEEEDARRRHEQQALGASRRRSSMAMVVENVFSVIKPVPDEELARPAKDAESYLAAISIAR